MPEQVRIFVSSPSDTQFERMRIDRVVERLNGEFAGLAQLSTIRWEREFYKADSTFQQQIPQAADCDIVIAILRHRLGTEMPKEFARMPNGEPYPSGTAYEILTAIDAGRKRGLPDVYVFRYPESPTVRLDDPATTAMVSEQWERLKTFFQAWFQTQAGHFTAAFQEFRSTDEFESQVDSLLRKWLAEKILKGRPVVWPIATKGSPFRGLAAFDSHHSSVFFGRTREITTAIDVLKDAAARAVPFLLVVGPSGAGKSSLARAGLLPRLTTPGVVPAVDIWRVAVMRPSALPDGPMASLAFSLLRGEADTTPDEQTNPLALTEIREGDFATPSALADVLAHADDTSVRCIVRALDRAGERERRSAGYERPVRADLVLVIDQLDELFAGDVPEERRRAFTQLLTAMVASGRVWIVATLRADLYERIVVDPALLDLKARGATYDLAPPGPAELAEIVRRPAEAAGLVYDTDAKTGERLDDRLLRDADRPDMLPLLQFTLQQLFEQRETVAGETRLPFGAYERLGGLAGAIDKEAERAVSALGDTERERLPRLLRQLAAPAQALEGERDSSHLTARSVPLSEAAYDDASTRLVRALVDARILLSSGSDAQGATIRLAHQRVLESWKRAQDIVAANADFYRVRNEIEEQHRRWKTNGRTRDLLIPTGLPLAEAESIRERYATELSNELNAYIDASSTRARAHQRYQQIAVAAFALLAVVAVAAGIWAIWQQRAAETALRDSRAATSRFLADLARQRLNEGFVGEAVALARSAVPVEVKDWPIVPTAENALALAMQTYSSAPIRPIVGYVGHEGAVRGAAFSPDGTRLVTWSYDGTARLWNVQIGAQLEVYRHDDGVRGARFSADGRRVLTWSFDGTVRLWPVGSTSAPLVLRHDDIVDGAVFSSDQERVLSWSDDGTARVWDAESGRALFTLRHKGVVVSARFLDNDQRILTRGFEDEDQVRIWSASDGALLASLKHDRILLGALVFGHDTRVLTWADDKSARIWEVATGKELMRLPLESASLTGATLSPDDSRVAAWSGQILHVWDAASGREIARIDQDGKVNGAELSTNGARLVTWADDNTVRFWDVASRKLLGRLNHLDAVIGAWISRDARHMLSWSYDGTAQVWSEGTDQRQRPDTARLVHGGVVRDAAFNQDETAIWTRSDDGTARLWSLGGIEIAALRHRAEIVGLVASPEGHSLATVSLDGTARLWDLAPQGRFVQMDHDGRIVSADFSGDAKSLVTASTDRTVRVWDLGSEKPRAVLRHQAPLVGASFSPDNARVVTWSEDGRIALWDAKNGTSMAAVMLPSAARGALYSRDRLIGWSADGLVRLWNTSSRQQLAEFPECGKQDRARFSEDGRSILIWCIDGSIRVLRSSDASQVVKLTHEHVAGAAISRDAGRVVSWSPDGALRVSTVDAGASTVAMRQLGVVGATFSVRGDRVLSWGGDDNAARIWDAGSGKEVAVLQHTKPINGAVFDADGDRVWTWSDDGSARLWEAASGKELVRLQHGEAVADAALVAGGRMLVTRSKGDGVNSSLRLWDIPTREVLGSAQTWPAARVSADGHYYASWSADEQTVRLWPLWAPVSVLADRAAQAAARLQPLSPLARCQAHLSNSGCDAFPATTDRLVALIADDRHLRLNVKAAAHDAENIGSADEHFSSDVKVEIFVNPRSEVFVFHNKPLDRPLERLEFNRATKRLVFRFSDGVAKDFGISVEERVAKYLDYARRALMVRVDDKTGKPIEGNEYPLLVY